MINNFVYHFISEIIKQKGLDNITVEDLVKKITPKGRGKTLGGSLTIESFSKHDAT